MRSKQCILYIQTSLFLFFALVFGGIQRGYAEKLENPRWTPKNAVTYPQVSIKDISSNGKYSLIQISQTSIKGNKAKNYSQCALVDNENLKNVIIGDQATECYQPHFVGEEKRFSYILHNIKNGQKILFTQDIESQARIQVKELEKDFYNYKFAPNGKSFAFIRKETPEQDSRIIEGEEKPSKLNLYLQKLDQNFQILGPPELLTPPDANLDAFEFSPSYVWSPDSQKIAFTSSNLVWKSGPYTEVYVLEINTKKVDKITEGLDFYYNLLFSPDGQNLLFLKLTGGGNQIGSIKPSPETCLQTIHVFDLKTRKESILPTKVKWIVAGRNENDKELIVLK